jgi:hypothetical protein
MERTDRVIRSQRTRLSPAVAAAALVLTVSACSSGATDCEEAFTAASLSVSGVVSAEWDCSEQFGGGWQRGDVVIEATTQDEAAEVVDALLRAYAASPDIEDAWATPQKYVSEDGSVIASAGDAGFHAVPNVGEVREHYGITPG